MLTAPTHCIGLAKCRVQTGKLGKFLGEARRAMLCHAAQLARLSKKYQARALVCLLSSCSFCRACHQPWAENAVKFLSRPLRTAQAVCICSCSFAWRPVVLELLHMPEVIVEIKVSSTVSMLAKPRLTNVSRRHPDRWWRNRNSSCCRSPERRPQANRKVLTTSTNKMGTPQRRLSAPGPDRRWTKRSSRFRCCSSHQCLQCEPRVPRRRTLRIAFPVARP